MTNQPIEEKCCEKCWDLSLSDDTRTCFVTDCPCHRPINEKWKIDFRKEFPSFLTDTHNGKIVPIYNGWWVFVQGDKRRNLPQDIEDFIEKLLEQERASAVEAREREIIKIIDSFPLQDTMFFDDANWKAGYKALEELKSYLIYPSEEKNYLIRNCHRCKKDYKDYTLYRAYEQYYRTNQVGVVSEWNECEQCKVDECLILTVQSDPHAIINLSKE